MTTWSKTSLSQNTDNTPINHQEFFHVRDCPRLMLESTCKHFSGTSTSRLSKTHVFSEVFQDSLERRQRWTTNHFSPGLFGQPIRGRVWELVLQGNSSRQQKPPLLFINFTAAIEGKWYVIEVFVRTNQQIPFAAHWKSALRLAKFPSLKVNKELQHKVENLSKSWRSWNQGSKY